MKVPHDITRRAGRAVLAALALAAAPALAEPQSFPIERMRGTLDANGIIAIESGSVPEHLQWDLALWFGYQSNPLVVVKQSTGERLAALVSDRAGGSVVAAIGLFDHAQLGLEIPVIGYQTRPFGAIEGVTSTPLEQLAPSGIGDVRIVPKFGLFHSRKGSLLDLSVLLPFTLPTGGGTSYRGDASFGVAPELAATLPLGRLRFGLNFGVPLRQTVTIANQAVRSEMLLSLGAAYRFFDDKNNDLPLELAVSGSSGTSIPGSFQHGNEVPAEVRAQAGWWFTQDLVATLGAGMGLNAGWGTPDWRVFAGLRYSPRPHNGDMDGDGILDADDKCPSAPEDKDGFEDADGCPDPDNDKDGILDTADKCPMQPEDKDGFEDADGCPDPDNDRDGVLDADDKCPLEPGPEYHAGCPDPDSDGDGVPDSKDKCPKEPEDKDGYADFDGCVDPDNDGDGTLDAADNCPNDQGPAALHGCPGETPAPAPAAAAPGAPPPEKDRDADSVIDRLDNCPDEPGTPENHGCKAKQLVELKAGKLEILDSVYFKLSKDIIEDRSFALLDNVVTVLKAHPEIPKVIVEGHTDNQGKAKKNRDLSQRRAGSVVKYLVNKGLEAGRLEAKGYGQERPIASNDDAEGRAKNRRVVFTIPGGEPDAVKRTDNGPTADTVEKPKDQKAEEPAKDADTSKGEKKSKKKKKKGGK